MTKKDKEKCLNYYKESKSNIVKFNRIKDDNYYYFQLLMFICICLGVLLFSVTLITIFVELINLK